MDSGIKFYLIFHLIFLPCKKFFSIRYLKFVNREKLVFENYLIQVAIQVTLRRNSREKKKQNPCKVSTKKKTIGVQEILDASCEREERPVWFSRLRRNRVIPFIVNEISFHSSSRFGQIFLPRKWRELVDY